MRVRLVIDTTLPGAFVIEAETPEECLILRMFTNWPGVVKTTGLGLKNHGGNVGEGRYSMMIGWGQEGGPEQNDDSKTQDTPQGD